MIRSLINNVRRKKQDKKTFFIHPKVHCYIIGNKKYEEYKIHRHEISQFYEKYFCSCCFKL